MVAFATLFLGLVLGPQVVEVVVDGPASAVELHLDGALVARRESPPWLFVIDFGTTYEPHILEAVARGTDGSELARAEQWLNIPRRPVEAELVLSAGENGAGVTAAVLWESRVEARPTEVLATFDGRRIEVTDPERISVPLHNPDELHLLQVELRFRGNYTTVVEKTLGGTYTDEVETRLTAVPIHLPKGARSPGATELANRFVGVSGEPLEVVAVDEGPAEVVVVRDAAAQRVLDELGSLRANRTLLERTRAGGVVSATRLLRHMGQLRKGQRVRFLYPVTIELFGHRTRQEQFPTSRFYSPTDGGLAWLMLKERKPISPDEQRLAEAVAVAGMEAALRNRRRTVLLLLAKNPLDASRVGPEVARRYLSTLRVPLVVWALEDTKPDGPWGPQRAIRNLSDLHAATRDLGKELARQRIVWLRGRHLPQRVSLLEDRDFRLAD